jgi:hypothetical protein
MKTKLLLLPTLTVSCLMSLAFGVVQSPAIQAMTTEDLSRAEAGVKLLMGIYGRLGSEPQLALKNEGKSKSDMRQDMALGVSPASLQREANSLSEPGQLLSNQLAFNNNADPALVIRPQQSNKKITVGRAVMQKVVPIEGMTIAMAPPSEKAPSRRVALQAAGFGAEKESRLAEKTESSKFAELKQEVQATNLRQRTSAIPYLAGNQIGTITPMQDKGHVREFNSDSKRTSYNTTIAQQNGDSFGGSMSASSYGAGMGAGMGAANFGRAVVSAERDDQDERSDKNEKFGLVRPAEQPGLFKYVREHAQPLPKQAPVDSEELGRKNISKDAAGEEVFLADKLMTVPPPAAMPQAAQYQQAKVQSKPQYKVAAGTEKKAREKAKAAPAREEPFITSARNAPGAPPLVAYLPPSTLRGINGLNLWVGEAETLNFLKSRGTIRSTATLGWKVVTLTNTQGQVACQAYLRNGKLEALRVYSSDLLPNSLGVPIDSDLTQMKSKYGEPSFVLEEPKTEKPSAVSAKNYVYPLSQVAFQIARDKNQGQGKPKVVSVLFFHYL